MVKMWSGRNSGKPSKKADDFNSSIGFDQRLYEEDIKGSMAHAAMLAYKKIISEDDAEKITEGLSGILEDIRSGKLEINPLSEDIHMFVEEILTDRIGPTGKKLHTARSRNDQVALDLRMYTRTEITNIISLLENLLVSITDKAEKYSDSVMPGYTHLQRAQPVMFGHYLMAYAMMFIRDIDRLRDALTRVNVSPVGSCALAGTTYDTDRRFEASQLGFDSICMNSLDGVSDRDFCVEYLSCLSLVMMHLSRLSEEMILYSSWEFRFIEMSDDYTTGSSIMPQKKNPDMTELIRGKTGRVYGDLIQMLTMLKGLPLAYNKDMQEDKESMFDATDTVKACLDIMAPVIATMNVRTDNMRKAAAEGFINATDLADYLVLKGMPFRDAYKISGSIVHDCIERKCVLETYPLEDYMKYSELFDETVYGFIDIDVCAEKRTSEGGTSSGSVRKQISFVRLYLDKT